MTYNKQLKILFWNARSIHKRSEESTHLLDGIDIFICVETWLSNDTASFDIPGFQILRKDRSETTGGGILMALRNGLKGTEINTLKDSNGKIEICGVKITNVSPQLDIIACYRPPRHRLHQEDWDIIVDNIENNSSCIFVGDFNAHHHQWNCSGDDANGNMLYNAIDRKDL